MSGLTDFHAKYFAHELTKRSPSASVEMLAGVLADAQVDLNPHQIEAALFAFQNPFSRGAILADEVGFGKSIEAGLLLAQRWAQTIAEADFIEWRPTRSALLISIISSPGSVAPRVCANRASASVAPPLQYSSLRAVRACQHPARSIMTHRLPMPFRSTWRW